MNIIKYLSDTLSIDQALLRKYLATSPHRYKKYKIPKRTQGYRDIAQPAKALKVLQKLVCKEFLNDLPVHSGCKAYREGLSIKDNALVHVNNKYLLKMDFKDFFPSIIPEDLINHMKSFYKGDISEEDETLLGKLFFYFPKGSDSLVLSIGAPSSPFISNTIMYNFDSLMNQACKEKGVSYSRYADDIAFSTNNKGVLFNYPKIVEEALAAISYPKILINHNKTVFLSRKSNMHITGLVLTSNGKVSIGRLKKRYIKSLVYQYTKDLLPPEKKSYLRGYLSFCLSVEPQFVVRLERKYGKEIMRKIQE